MRFLVQSGEVPMFVTRSSWEARVRIDLYSKKFYKLLEESIDIYSVIVP